MIRSRIYMVFFYAEVRLKRFDCSHFRQSWRLLCPDCCGADSNYYANQKKKEVVEDVQYLKGDPLLSKAAFLMAAGLTSDQSLNDDSGASLAKVIFNITEFSR